MLIAVRHLVELGHERIAHLAGPQDLSTGVARLRAFRQALEDHGLPSAPERIAVCPAWTQAAGAEGADRLFDSVDGSPGAEFTAVLAGNDLLALGCYDALARRGLRCPEDVSVVGFNDMPFIDRFCPPMTSVRIAHYEIGAEAARLLLEELREPGRHPRSIVLPLKLCVRESTAPPKSRARGRGRSAS
jgi:LacI family transcriptional regulator